MRKCKSCGKYFSVTGYANTEYCDREFQNSGKSCKEVGAVWLLQNKLSTDPVHKAYSRAYKTHFARIKYGKITKEEFTICSEKAREMRDKTLAGEISLTNFGQWLKTKFESHLSKCELVELTRKKAPCLQLEVKRQGAQC